MSLAFSARAERELGAIFERYPRKDAALLPVLWLAQREFGHLSAEARDYVALKVGVSLARVESVISFYTLYRTRETGKHHFQICRNLSCVLRGAEKLMETAERVLELKPGETSPDGKFTYSTVECLAACGGAPAMQVNGLYHENVTPEKLEKMIAELKGSGTDR